ncbi:hypothetical protein [Aquirhabdus sp.]|uniref:COG4705 family protein n=1 Tax=Aquirhabdus sp. TaxID=2824160 RepID=UPI00396C58A5
MTTLSLQPSSHLLNKVPEVTLFFWIIKMMSTTVGETAADFLIFNVHLGLTVTSIIMGVLLLISLSIQLRCQRYIPWIYWLTVVLISIFGTLITDNLVDHFGVPLAVATAVFSIALIATFISWYASERTLSIHTIYTKKRELFYWAAILFTFALGTAAGDLVAEGLKLGYLNSALMFGAVIGSIAIVYYVFKRHAITAFWMAYILTRPFGASWGDYLSQAVNSGGLGLGTTGTSVLFLVVILGLVTYLSIQNEKATS